MKPHSYYRAVVNEALAVARSQPVVSALTLLIVAGMVATVLLTTGRTVGAEQAVIATIDDAGTRSIIVRADTGAGFTAEVLDRLEGIEGIEWSIAFGGVKDVTNAEVTDGTKVPSRLVWSDDLTPLGIDDGHLAGEFAWASALALDRLGMLGPAGGVSQESGVSYGIGGSVKVPEELSFLEPLLVVPQTDATRAQEVSVLVVVAASPALVAPLTQLVRSVIGVSDPALVKVTTSEALATLRSIVEGQLGSFGRSLVVVMFLVTAILVATILYGLVVMRRKDFGRRRALGASQGLIVGLLLTQTAVVAAIGAVAGAVAAGLGLVASHDPLPDPAYFAAVCVLAVFVSIVAAAVPAVVASRRDPLTELRVP